MFNLDFEYFVWIAISVTDQSGKVVPVAEHVSAQKVDNGSLLDLEPV